MFAALIVLGTLVLGTFAEAGKPAIPGGNGRGRKDTTPPTLVCPSGITVDAMATIGAYVAYTVSVSDDKDPAPVVTYSHPSGSTFPVGTTTVTVTATDWKNNSTTCTFDVTVVASEAASFSYKNEAWAWDLEIGDYVLWYEWSYTVAADGTVTGTAVQHYLEIYYWAYDELYAAPMPPDTTGGGSVSGTISPDGTSELDLSYNGWYLDAYDYEDPGILTEWTYAFNGTTKATLDPAGNLVFNGEGGYYAIWYKN